MITPVKPPYTRLDILKAKVFVLSIAITIFTLLVYSLGQIGESNKTYSEIDKRLQLFYKANSTTITIVQKNRYGEKIIDTMLQDTGIISKLKKYCVPVNEQSVGRMGMSKFIHEIHFNSPEKIFIQVYVNNYTAFFIPIKLGENFTENFYVTNRKLKHFFDELNL